MNGQDSGLYIHVPFCKQKCRYCDFYSLTDLSQKDGYIRALEKEMLLRRDRSRQFDTVYFGGGTPSLLTPKDIKNILGAARRCYNLSPHSEITMEMNPGTVNYQGLEGFARAGVNRINLGIQSFSPNNLKFLGRIHSAHEAELAFLNAEKAGFRNIGIDLIHGIPGQTMESWGEDLQKGVSLKPDHISCYMLTLEHGTPLYKAMSKKEFSPMEDGKGAELFEATVDILRENGYIWYEISNFARTEKSRSRHNLKYWSFTPYVGLGPSAHSFIPNKRSWNHLSLEKYVLSLEKGVLPIEGSETLSKEQQIMEALYVGLRRTDGIETLRFREKFGLDFAALFGETCSFLKESGLAENINGSFRLTKKGMLFHDRITSMLADDIP